MIDWSKKITVADKQLEQAKQDAMRLEAEMKQLDSDCVSLLRKAVLNLASAEELQQLADCEQYVQRLKEQRQTLEI